MKIIDIHNLWGTKIYLDSPSEFFNYDREYWKNLLYTRKVLILKEVNFSMKEYYSFASNFGTPNSYFNHYKDKPMPGLHPFSNKTIPILGEHSMPWHADFPNSPDNPFPLRSLWMYNNPNPLGGITSFLNISDSIDLLNDRLKNLIPDVQIIQQDWRAPEIEHYALGMNRQVLSFLKTHPILNTKSLRINSYVTKSLPSEWILGVIIKNIIQPDCLLLEEYISDISSHNDMIYHHTWNLKDIVIYDNWGLVHKRTDLNLPSDTERLIYRVNIAHEL